MPFLPSYLPLISLSSVLFFFQLFLCLFPFPSSSLTYFFVFLLSRSFFDHTITLTFIYLKVITIQELVNEDEVVLDVFLADLAEVGRHHVTHLVEELEHHGGVDVLLGDGSQPDVGALHVEEAGACDVGDGRAHLLAGVDHVHTERVHRIPPAAEWREKRSGSEQISHTNPLITPHCH